MKVYVGITKRGRVVVTKSERSIQKFLSETPTASAYERTLSENFERRQIEEIKKDGSILVAVIKNNGKLADFRFICKDDEYHESIGEMVNAHYILGSYTIKKVKVSA